MAEHDPADFCKVPPSGPSDHPHYDIQCFRGWTLILNMRGRVGDTDAPLFKLTLCGKSENPLQDGQSTDLVGRLPVRILTGDAAKTGFDFLLAPLNECTGGGPDYHVSWHVGC